MPTNQVAEKPFRVEVVADSTGKWCSNMLTYDTLEEAIKQGLDLAHRWRLVRNVRVVEKQANGLEVVVWQAVG